MGKMRDSTHPYREIGWALYCPRMQTTWAITSNCRLIFKDKQAKQRRYIKTDMMQCSQPDSQILIHITWQGLLLWFCFRFRFVLGIPVNVRTDAAIPNHYHPPPSSPSPRAKNLSKHARAKHSSSTASPDQANSATLRAGQCSSPAWWSCKRPSLTQAWTICFSALPRWLRCMVKCAEAR